MLKIKDWKTGIFAKGFCFLEKGEKGGGGGGGASAVSYCDVASRVYCFQKNVVLCACVW